MPLCDLSTSRRKRLTFPLLSPHTRRICMWHLFEVSWARTASQKSSGNAAVQSYSVRGWHL